MQEAELTYIEGTVDAVIYQNRENGYTVLRLDAGEGRGLTVVGCLPGVAPGESISVQGTWMHHASYGEQFKAEAVERRMPAGTKAIFDYLASGAVRGIGAATARRMVEEFGEEALTVLEEHPERLTQIKGITRKRALAMGEHFRQQMGMRRLLEFLGEHEVPLQLAMPLYRKYGDRALEIIRGNPYLLVDRELGVDFSNADALALSMGMEGDDPQRLEAGLLFELTHNLDNGHTFLPRRKLLPATAQLIGVGEEALEEALEALCRAAQAELAGRPCWSGARWWRSRWPGSRPSTSMICARRSSMWPSGCGSWRRGRSWPPMGWRNSSTASRPSRASPMPHSSARQWSWPPPAR